MIRKTVKVALLAAILAAVGVGFAVSQMLVQRSLTASVTVSASAGLTLLDEDGNPITSLDYGDIPVNTWVNQTIIVQNSGNMPLSLTCARTDAAMGISTNFAYTSGEWFQPASPKPLAPGESITVVIEVQAGNEALGDYSPLQDHSPSASKVTGS